MPYWSQLQTSPPESGLEQVQQQICPQSAQPEREQERKKARDSNKWTSVTALFGEDLFTS